MNTIITTTKDYNLFAQNENWEKLECSSLVNFLNTFFAPYGLSIQKFYAKESSMTRFWVVRNQPAPELKLLRRCHNNDTILYVLPCIPKFYLDNESGMGLHLNKEQCQNYLAAVIKQILSLEPNTKKENIILLAHDRDLGIKGNRVMRIRDIHPQSKLKTIITEGTIYMNNIFAFQHEDDLKAYTLIKSMLRKEIDNNLFTSFISLLRTSEKEQNELEKG